MASTLPKYESSPMQINWESTNRCFNRSLKLSLSLNCCSVVFDCAVDAVEKVENRQNPNCRN